MSKFQRLNIVLKESRTMYFDSVLAEQYGLTESILIHYIFLCLEINKKSRKNHIDNTCWMYQSLKEINRQLPFLSHRKIRAAFNNLEAHKLLIKGIFCKELDKSIWYSLSDDLMSYLTRRKGSPLHRSRNSSTYSIKSEIVAGIETVKTK